jgi:hypothetical protein
VLDYLTRKPHILTWLKKEEIDGTAEPASTGREGRRRRRRHRSNQQLLPIAA